MYFSLTDLTCWNVGIISNPKNIWINICFLFIHHHHHVAMVAQISLILSRHPFLSSIAPVKSSMLLDISSSWSSYLFSSMWRGPREFIAYEFVLTSPWVSRISDSSNLDSFRDRWLVAVQLLFCRVLLLGLVQYSSQHSCVIVAELFLYTFS